MGKIKETTKLFKCEAQSKFQGKDGIKMAFTLRPVSGNTPWWIDEAKGRLFVVSPHEKQFEIGKMYRIRIEAVDPSEILDEA